MDKNSVCAIFAHTVDNVKISHEIACDKALTEFEKYRVKQDKLFSSDFDLFMLESNNIKEN